MGLFFIVGLATAIVYAYVGRQSSATLQLTLSSLYGPAISVMLLLPLHSSGTTHRFETAPVLFAQVLPLALVIYSLARYPGRKYVHLLMPFNVIPWLSWVFMLLWLNN